MISIELHDLHIYARHGVYEGEEETGNPYIINLDVRYDERDLDFDDLRNTIDYTDLFEIVKKRMQYPTGLLEKVCESIVRRIKHQYPFVKEIILSIHKRQAPIPHFQGSAGVRLSKVFTD